MRGPSHLDLANTRNEGKVDPPRCAPAHPAALDAANVKGGIVVVLMVAKWAFLMPFSEKMALFQNFFVSTFFVLSEISMAFSRPEDLATLVVLGWISRRRGD